MTVVNGDYTLTCEIEDFTIEAEDLWEKEYDAYHFVKWVPNVTNYAIRSSNILPNEDGTYFTVTKRAANRPIERTATIEIESWDLSQINDAQRAAKAPSDAIPTYERKDGKHYVQFRWEEK